MTRDKAQSRKDKAAQFVETVLKDGEHAAVIREEYLDDWAKRKHLKLTNTTNRRDRTMANTVTKAELESTIDSVVEILSAAYTPEASREELAAAVGEALDVLEGSDADEDQEDEEEADNS